MNKFAPNFESLQSDVSITDASVFAETMLLEFVRQYMDHHGITQAAVAEMSGIKQANVSRILSNRYSPNLRTLLRLCGALNLRIEIASTIP